MFFHSTSLKYQSPIHAQVFCRTHTLFHASVYLFCLLIHLNKYSSTSLYNWKSKYFFRFLFFKVFQVFWRPLLSYTKNPFGILTGYIKSIDCLERRSLSHLPTMNMGYFSTQQAFKISFKNVLQFYIYRFCNLLLDLFLNIVLHILNCYC